MFWTITTHKIDPDIAETRDFLIQDLWYSQGLKSFGYVKGVGAAAYDSPRSNLTGDPYFKDGYRAVLWVSDQPIAFSDVGWIDWEVPEEKEKNPGPEGQIMNVRITNISHK